MKMTKSQEKVLNRIKEKDEKWNINSVEIWEYCGIVCVSLENRQTHFMLHESYLIKIGKRGKIDFFSSNVFSSSDNDKERKRHEKTCASLCGYDLFGSYPFSVNLI